jgi:hypothetical protein
LVHIGVARAADDRLRLDAPAPNLRRVNFIERQRDQCDSAAVTDARTEQRPGSLPTPLLPAVATLPADARDRR